MLELDELPAELPADAPDAPPDEPPTEGPLLLPPDEPPPKEPLLRLPKLPPNEGTEAGAEIVGARGVGAGVLIFGADTGGGA